jgi:hypothetical protein
MNATVNTPQTDIEKAWYNINPILRGAKDLEDFKAGWTTAMSSIWERLPMPALGIDPMDSREVGKLLNYIQRNLPENK